MEVWPIVALAFVASITPGPNNLMLWASGMNYGVRRTLPHVAGINVGFSLLLFLVALGLGSVFDRYAGIELALKIAGSLYLLYLAWKIFGTGAVQAEAGDEKPMTFTQAALFQWVNPKAWVMTTTASSTLLAGDGPLVMRALALTAIFSAVNLPCICTWLFTGAFAGQHLHQERYLRLINRTLGALLAGTVVFLVA